MVPVIWIEELVGSVDGNAIANGRHEKDVNAGCRRNLRVMNALCGL